MDGLSLPRKPHGTELYHEQFDGKERIVVSCCPIYLLENVHIIVRNVEDHIRAWMVSESKIL